MLFPRFVGTAGAILIATASSSGCSATLITPPAQAIAGASGTLGTAGASHVAAGAAAGTASTLPTLPRAGAAAPPASNDDDAGVTKAPAADGGSALGMPDFSDSFETSSMLDPARYEIVMPSCSGTGTVALDATAAHSGTHSVRVNGAAGYCNHVFFRPKTLPAQLPDPLFVRVFVKLDQPLGAGHTTFVAMHDAHEDKDLRMGGQDQILMWNRESDDATLPELSPTGVSMSIAPTIGKWHCIEWTISGHKPGLTTWVDSAAIAGLVVDGVPTPDVDRQWLSKTGWQPQLTDVRFGWESYGDQAETLWFDDLAIGKTRIGCGAGP